MKNNKFISTLWRYVKFALSTLVGTGVDMLVLWLCANFLFNNTFFILSGAQFGLVDGYKWGEYILSPIISFECAVFVNFVIAYFFVWKDRISNRSNRSFWRHYGGYNLTSTGTFLLKMCILLLFERITHWDVVWCNLAALCVSGIMNFAFNELLVFRKTKSIILNQED